MVNFKSLKLKIKLNYSKSGRTDTSTVVNSAMIQVETLSRGANDRHSKETCTTVDVFGDDDHYRRYIEYCRYCVYYTVQ